jgi:cellobiose PTS system EIIC component
MSKFDSLADKMSLIAEKVDDNKYLSVIKNAFSMYMPFIIVGSFASLGNVLITSETTGLAKFESFKFLTALKPAFSALSFATMGIMTISIIVILAALLARKNHENEILSAIVALGAYISIVPQSIASIVDGVEKLVSGLPEASINSSGLFIGMILTILVVELFNKLCKIEKIKIKMPPQVPSAISKSFNVLIPIFITLFVVAIFGRMFVLLTGIYLNDFIYQILQVPMEVFLQTPAGTIGLAIFSQLFWVVGIHGGLVISPLRSPIMAAALAANIAAVEAGNAPTNAVTMSTWRAFINIGGAGLVFSLIIALFIASKRKEQRAIAKIGLIPSIFSISEPVSFGLPLVLNPTYAIPFVFSAGISSVITLLAFQFGILTPNFVDVPYGLPIIMNAFLGWGINGVIVQIIVIAAGVLTYLPFVLLANKQKGSEVEETAE